MPVKIKGLNETIKRLQRRRNAFQGKRLYNKVSTIGKQSTRKNFDVGAWAARTKDYSWPILNKTGWLKSDATQGWKGWIKAGKHYINRIRTIYWGQFHQFGTSKMPMRKFILLQKFEIEKMKKLFRDAFLGK